MYRTGIVLFRQMRVLYIYIEPLPRARVCCFVYIKKKPVFYTRAAGEREENALHTHSLSHTMRRRVSREWLDATESPPAASLALVAARSLAASPLSLCLSTTTTTTTTRVHTPLHTPRASRIRACMCEWEDGRSVCAPSTCAWAARERVFVFFFGRGI